MNETTGHRADAMSTDGESDRRHPQFPDLLPAKGVGADAVGRASAGIRGGADCPDCARLDAMMVRAGRDKSAQTDVRVLRRRHAPDCLRERARGTV
jgi:hypothetical protein